MKESEHKIDLEFLDHVALRVTDLEASAQWYEEVLSLTRYTFPEWGDYPILLLSGKTGVALFPANTEGPKIDPKSKSLKIDHFAFQVSKSNFERAIQHFRELNLDFSLQDHHYFDSIYIKDPDGHLVELTMLKVKEEDFYG